MEGNDDHNDHNSKLQRTRYCFLKKKKKTNLWHFKKKKSPLKPIPHMYTHTIFSVTVRKVNLHLHCIMVPELILSDLFFKTN